MGSDPFAHLKDDAWRELEAIDRRLADGEIDEEAWYTEVAALIVPAYLGADTPWGQSGKTGDAEGWEYSRSLVADAIEAPGTFLDVGCANGFLMESIVRWSAFRVEPFGLEIAPDLAALARDRLPEWSDRIFVGNALTWEPEPPRRFTYVRTNLDYVPRRRRRELVARLLSFGERVIVGVFNEHTSERTTEEALAGWGFSIAGSTARPHRTKPGMEYRALWLDAAP